MRADAQSRTKVSGSLHMQQSLLPSSYRSASDDETWRVLEEDPFEWSAEYGDYAMYYYAIATAAWLW